jgi:O-antigen biosynthesis protein
MAEPARRWCRRLVVGDVELLDLDRVLDGEVYEIIVCGDVLEHLRDPWSFARRLSRRLGPGGRLLLSVPNVAYLGLLVDLLRGNFRYRDVGLLDRTHLRFFTFDSLRELLEEAGWHLWAAEQVTLSLTDSEFRVRLESLAPALRDELLARPDALCYQWVVEARLSPPPNAVALPQTPPEDRFQVRVFWRGAGTSFGDARNRLVWGALGRDDQSVTLDFPQGQEALGIRLSDRVGFVRLRRIRLMGAGTVPIWDWNAGREALPVAGRVEMEAAGNDGLWYVAGTSSRLDLDLPADKVSIANRVELQLDSPLSADFLAAKAFWSADRGMQAPSESDSSTRERLADVRAALGDDESMWSRYASVVRLAKSVPGLVAAIHWLATGGKRGRGVGDRDR